ncbi:MAG: YigZ family protein [Clostridia bacterium]|nr:YigZ family protein [Clostridia bacterium]
MKLYSTVEREASAEQIIEKSRFITYVKPVSSKEEADAFIAEIKKKHKDATHNVPAMVIGDKFQIQWASDDGEPQGTSGAPIVQMLVQEGVTNVAIVVTRYFGGIKLGTGGLVRAYTSSAKLGLEAAKVIEIFEKKVLTYQVDYGIFNKLSNFTFEQNVSIENVVYTDVVKFDLVVEPEETDLVKNAVTGISNGREILESEELKKS